jgi:outer membrane protein
MKNNMLKLAFAFLTIGTICTSLSAQSLKLGHLNSQELLASMPGTKAADQKLQEFNKSLEGQLKSMSTEYQGKVEQFKGQEASMAEAIKQAKIKEIQDLEARIQEFQQNAQESIQKKKQEFYSPVLKQAEEAIKSVAKENNYSYILDVSAGTVLYSHDSDNIMALVKKKLGLTAATPAPATPPAK